MRTASRWTVLVAGLAAGVILVTCGPSAASAARTESSAPTSARTAGEALGNYRITGIEDAIGCLTAHRCVAVGYGGGRAPGQVVTVVGGKQVRLAVARSASNLIAVSCPNRFGCWAMGPPRNGHDGWVLVKIGPTGSITKVTSVRLPAQVSPSFISCTTRTSCEVFGTTTNAKGRQERWYLASWNGRKLSHRHAAGCGNCSNVYFPGGISCWQTTCVAVGQWWCSGSTCQGRDAVVTTSRGKVEVAADLINKGGLSGVSCVSSSTCYAISVDSVVTLDNGAVGATQNLPVYAGPIECAGGTCWAAANSPAGFVMIVNGAPTGTPLADPALAVPSAIARRGDGFAAVGKPASGGARVSEVVIN